MTNLQTRMRKNIHQWSFPFFKIIVSNYNWSFEIISEECLGTTVFWEHFVSFHKQITPAKFIIIFAIRCIASILVIFYSLQNMIISSSILKPWNGNPIHQQIIPFWPHGNEIHCHICYHLLLVPLNISRPFTNPTSDQIFWRHGQYNSRQILKPLPGLSLMQHKIDRALTPKSFSPRLSPLITACTTSLGDTRLSSPTLSVVQSRWGQYLTSKYSTPLNASSSQNSWAILSIAATSFLKISILNQ